MNKKNIILLLLIVVFFVGVTMIYVNYYTSDDVRIYAQQTDEDYCGELCSNEELYSMGCDKQILGHLKKYSNLFDEKFDGNYVIATIGLPDGMSWKKLQECANFIVEKRIPVYKITKKDKMFDVQYSINEGIVKNMIFSNDANSLLVTINSTEKGSLKINIPRELLDAKMDYCPPRLDNSPDDTFFVLMDGTEIDYDEIEPTSKSRTLQIPFSENTVKIEIIGTCLI